MQRPAQLARRGLFGQHRCLSSHIVGIELTKGVNLVLGHVDAGQDGLGDVGGCELPAGHGVRDLAHPEVERQSLRLNGHVLSS